MRDLIGVHDGLPGRRDLAGPTAVAVAVARLVGGLLADDAGDLLGQAHSLFDADFDDGPDQMAADDMRVGSIPICHVTVCVCQRTIFVMLSDARERLNINCENSEVATICA